MRKKTIAILLGIGAGVGVIGLIVLVIGFVALASATSACSPDCASAGEQVSPGMLGATLIGSVLFLSGMIVGCVSWVGALVKQAKQQQWGWFAGTLASGLIASYLSGICILIYLIVVPEQQPVLPGYLPMPPYQAGVLYQPMPVYQTGEQYQAAPQYPAVDPYGAAPVYPSTDQPQARPQYPPTEYGAPPQYPPQG